ncbi:Monothiol glutaredoxin-S17 (AtGrxS17), partial [Durusdinium trenchii]
EADARLLECVVRCFKALSTDARALATCAQELPSVASPFLLWGLAHQDADTVRRSAVAMRRFATASYYVPGAVVPRAWLREALARWHRDARNRSSLYALRCELVRLIRVLAKLEHGQPDPVSVEPFFATCADVLAETVLQSSGTADDPAAALGSNDPEGYDSDDGEPHGFDALRANCLDALREGLGRCSRDGVAAEQVARLTQLCIQACQLTQRLQDIFQDDPNEFLALDADETMLQFPRHAGPDLLVALFQVEARVVLTTLDHESRSSEAILESVMWLLGNLWMELGDELGLHGPYGEGVDSSSCPAAFQRLVHGLVASCLAHQASLGPLVLARLLWMMWCCSVPFSPVIERLVLSCLTSEAAPLALRMYACRVFARFAAQSLATKSPEEFNALLIGLLQLLQSNSSDTVHISLETIDVVLALDNGDLVRSCMQPAVRQQFLELLFDLWSRGVEQDPFLRDLVVRALLTVGPGRLMSASPTSAAFLQQAFACAPSLVVRLNEQDRGELLGPTLEPLVDHLVQALQGDPFNVDLLACFESAVLVTCSSASLPVLLRHISFLNQVLPPCQAVGERDNRDRSIAKLFELGLASARTQHGNPLSAATEIRALLGNPALTRTALAHSGLLSQLELMLLSRDDAVALLSLDLDGAAHLCVQLVENRQTSFSLAAATQLLVRFPQLSSRFRLQVRNWLRETEHDAACQPPTRATDDDELWSFALPSENLAVAGTASDSDLESNTELYARLSEAERARLHDQSMTAIRQPTRKESPVIEARRRANEARRASAMTEVADMDAFGKAVAPANKVRGRWAGAGRAGGDRGSSMGPGHLELKPTPESGMDQRRQNKRDEVVVAYFWADFHEACKAGGQMDQVIALLQKQYGVRVRFVKAEAEKVYDAAEGLGVSMVPSFVLLKNGKKLDMVEGANPAKLQSALERHAGSATSKTSTSTSSTTTPTGTDESLEARLGRLTTSSHVILFMKGNPTEPRCKFSRAIVEILNKHDVRFASFDILQDNEVREGLKTFANHSTYPQLWIGGQLVGGLDTVKELAEANNGEALKAALARNVVAPRSAPSRPPQAPAAAANAGPVVVDDAYLKSLTASAPVMLFMKGSPTAPQCGFSAKMVDLLGKHKIEFSTFDILQNEDVRQKLKTFANWPTFPQLYVNGSLVGGLDIVQEMAEEGDLVDELGVETLEQRLQKLVKKAPVMLFMKGTPETPRCGFSREIVGILQAEGTTFETFDILEDNAVRQGLKEFSKWPTFPQLYVDGKLVGGLDIVRELKEEDELADVLRAE